MPFQHPLRPAEQIGAISRAIVHIAVEYIGRGPTSVRAIIGPDLICVVVRDSLTKGEQLLVAGGRGELVSELRRAYFQAMQPELDRAVGTITGRDVLAVLGDHSTDPDVSTITFVLAPQLAPCTPSLALLDQEPLRSAEERALAHRYPGHLRNAGPTATTHRRNTMAKQHPSSSPMREAHRPAATAA